MKRYLQLLFRQWWFSAWTILAGVSTVSTFVPAFYSRFAVPRVVPLLVFLVGFFVASYKVYLHEVRTHIADVENLKTQIAKLKVNPQEVRKKIFEVMRLNYNMKFTEIVTLSGMSEDDVLESLEALKHSELVIPIDVNEVPKGSFWRRIV